MSDPISDPISRAQSTVHGPRGLRLSPWNLLLLVPFLMLVTPWINKLEPRLFGLPFFYWVQFACVPVGVVCVAIVYVMTRDKPGPVAGTTPGDVDGLDAGATR